jgi:uncharacterized protein (DUF849 family)
MEKLIIQVRVNEGTKRDKSPHIPYSPKEIADQSIECWRAGASIVHYHAREPETGEKTSDIETYAETVRRIKNECDMLTFPTLGAAMLPTAKERLAHIASMAADPATRPDFIPIDMTTTNLTWYNPGERRFEGDGDLVYRNTVNILRELCESARAVGVTPVSMLWNISSIRMTEAFIDMGLFRDPLICEVCLYADHLRGFGHHASIKGLMSMLDFLPQGRNWVWMADALGVNAFAVNAAAIEMGGHVVTGLGDYAYPELGYPTNAQLVAKVAEMARYMGREIATPAEAKAMLGLS